MQKKPELRFSNFIIDWDQKAINEIGKTFNGLTGKNAENFGEGDPFITYKQIFDNSRIDITKFGFVKVEPGEKQNKVKYGDFLFTTSSETPQEVGFCSVFLDKTITPYLNSFSFGYRPFSLNTLHPNFGRYYFHSHLFRKYVVKLAQGSTRYNISKDAFTRIKIFIPKVDEQRKISEFLESVDQWIENLKKQKEAFEKYKRGMMQKIFSQEVRFKDENGKDFPDWGEKKLEELASITTGKKDVNSGDPKGKFPFFTCAKEHTYSNEYSFQGEAIMIAGNAEVGLCSYYIGNFEAYQRTYVLQQFKINGKFLFKYLSHYFRQYALGLKQSGAMSFIKLGMITGFRVPVPSNEEQQKIAVFLTSIDKLIEAKGEQISKAEQWKKGLMQKMFV